VKERAERVALESPHFEAGKPWDAQTPRPLPVIPDATQSFEIWSWSPDGRLLAGQKHLADLSHAGIGVHELGSQEIEWLTDFGEWPVFLKDGRRILFSFQGKLFVIDRVSRAVPEQPWQRGAVAGRTGGLFHLHGCRSRHLDDDGEMTSG
jgi:hypothetical protein